jgi:hypothetical protein
MDFARTRTATTVGLTPFYLFKLSFCFIIIFIGLSSTSYESDLAVVVEAQEES